MNRVNSIRVESGAWVCFDHPDFRGQQFILEHGDYPEFFRWNGHNDHMGSCRPVGMVSGLLHLGAGNFQLKQWKVSLAFNQKHGHLPTRKP